MSPRSKQSKKPHGGVALLKFKSGNGPLPHRESLLPSPTLWVRRPNTNAIPRFTMPLMMSPIITGPSNRGINRYDCGDSSLPKNTTREAARRAKQQENFIAKRGG